MLRYEDGHGEDGKNAQNAEATKDTYDKVFANPFSFQAFLSREFSKDYLKGKPFTRIDSPKQFCRAALYTPFYIVICLMGAVLYKPFAFYGEFLKEEKETSILPPFIAVLLLCLFVPANQYDAVDDARGQYFEKLEDSGPVAAKRLYWSIVGKSLWPFVYQLARKIVRWVFFGWLDSLLHRFIR